MTYEMDIAGLKRELPLCKVTDDLYIGAFVMFGDVELTVHCAAELLKLAPEYDYMIAPEAKSIPLLYEMARQSGAEKYFLARKGPKAYMSGIFKASSPTLGSSRVISSLPSLVSRASQSYSSIWMVVKISAFTKSSFSKTASS